MTRLFVAFALLLSLVAAAPLIEEFDVPLMPGMAERADQRLAFDKVDGRIIETILEGKVQPKALTRYYQQALPPLGWTPGKAGATATRLVFTRGPERLVLDVGKPRKGVLRVRLLLEPAAR
jgi:hypothetical protein